MSASLLYPQHKAPDSGAQRLVGYDTDLTATDGSAKVWLDLEPRHLNRNDTLHGGIHAMMLDAAAGFAASRTLSGGADEIVPVVTLMLNTSFVAPAQVGRVTATGRVTSGGYKIIHAEAEIRDAEGRLCSTASGVFKRAST